LSQYKTHKTDKNQGEVVEYLEGIGASVQDLSPVGGGCVDLLVGYQGVNYCVEVKMPNGKVTPAQWKWHDNWQGQKIIVESATEMRDFISAYHIARDWEGA